MDIKSDCERARRILKEIFADAGYDKGIVDYNELFDRSYEDKKEVKTHYLELRASFVSQLQMDMAFLKASYLETLEENSL